MSVFGVFLFRIFPHLDWIRRDTEYLSVFSSNAGKYGAEKIQIQAIFTQCLLLTLLQISLYFSKNSSSSIKKICPLSVTMIVFHVSTCFWKYYASWFNFMIIVFVTNKIFTISFTWRNHIRHLSFCNIYIYNEIRFLQWWNLRFLISISPRVIIYLSIFYTQQR